MRVILRPGRAKPFFFRHPWIFSGAVGSVDEACRDGDLVDVVDDRGKWIGRGFLNRRSKILVRLVSWDPDEVVDRAWLGRRIEDARSLREDLLALPLRTDAYRLVHGEGDRLPGLVVDRYGDVLVVAISSLFMEEWKGTVFDILEERFKPKGIYERGDAEIRDKEGLPPSRGWARGGPGSGQVVEGVPPLGLTFEVDVVHGQKTGLYLDQRDNRARVASLSAGRRVLDACTYTGGFALVAARAGATEVLAFDRSRNALDAAERNATANGLTVRFFQGEVFETLASLRGRGESFGLVVLDPPKFAKARGEVDDALDGYRELNALGAALVDRGGILVTCSCTGQVSEDAFERAINEGAVKAGRTLVVLDRLGQAPDHPVAAACPEGRYLTCSVCRVL